MSLAGDPIFSDLDKEGKIIEAVGKDLRRKGYPIDDYFIDTARDGDIRVYTRVIKLPRNEFLCKYLDSKKVTLGNMCELEVPKLSEKEE